MLNLFPIPILLIYASLLSAQKKAQPTREMGIQLITWERNYETMNNPLALKLVPGIYYLRHFRRWDWVSSFAYGNNPIDDNCKDCGDQIFGIGSLKEWSIQSGLRQYMFQSRKFPVKPFVESGLYYSNLRYIATDFQGGHSGGRFNFDDIHWSAGLYGRFGLTYSPNKLLTISAFTSYKIGIGKVRNNINEKSHRSLSMTGSLLQFSAGYRFYPPYPTTNRFIVNTLPLAVTR